MSLSQALCAVQLRADIIVLIPVFFVLFRNSICLSLKSLHPECGKWEINLFSGSIHFLLPVALVCWTDILGDLSIGGLCVSRGERRVKSWRNGGCPESHEKLSGLGGVRVSGSICFKET